MANANGVWLKAHVYREGQYLKADVHMVTAGEPTVFTVAVDMVPIARAVKAYHDKYLSDADHAQVGGEDCIGCDTVGSLFSKIKKTVKKVTKNKLVKQITTTAKAVVKSKITGAAVAALAVAFPPVGVPAAAAYATANVALAAIERAQEVRKTAASAVQKAKALGKKATVKPETAAKMKQVFALEAKAKEKIRAVADTAKYSEDPKKRADAAKLGTIISMVAATRAKVRAIPTKAKKVQGKNRIKGLVVNERGLIVHGTFDENPLGKGAALLYRPGRSIKGSYTKVGGCIGCALGNNPWPMLR